MSVPVEPFQKFATTTIFYDSTEMPPCPLFNDCDRDGITNDVEGTDDADGDGWPAHYDPDSNNDDISDEEAGTGDDDGDGDENFRDDDIDGDGFDNVEDTCPLVEDPDQEDLDEDELGDACDPDIDDDGFPNGTDTCPDVPNPAQGPGCPDPDVDLDGDGLAELLWQSCGAGLQFLWTVSDPSFEVTPFTPLPPLFSWYAVGLADLNGDGHTDVLYAHLTTGATRAWLLNGTDVIDVRNGPTVGSAWRYYAAGLRDMDGDGFADMILLDRYFGETRVQRMQGLTGLNIVNLPDRSSTTGRLQAVADIDNDGKADLLFYNKLLQRMTLWKMNGLTRTATQTFPGPLPALEYYVAAVDDFDGDGKNDLLWHNPLLTVATLWTMNGTVKLDSHPIAAPSPIPGLPLTLLPGVIGNASGGPLCFGL